MERELLRNQTTDLLQRLRGTEIEHVLFELLDVIVRRLDRIELGHFEDPSDVPTEPGRRISKEMPATKVETPLPERTKRIFDAAKPPRNSKPPPSPRTPKKR